jgi:hypothetical protein
MITVLIAKPSWLLFGPDLISFEHAIVVMGRADVMMLQSQISAGTGLSE